MLKRSCPRSSSLRVMANGNSVTGWPFSLPVCRKSSSFRCPRGTVPSTSVRDALPSANTRLASSGSLRGLSCISCRQPASDRTATTSNTTGSDLPHLCPVPSALRPVSARLMGHLHHFARLQRVEQPACAIRLELGIVRFDHQEETFLTG